jgi:microcystin-dependent protein
VFHFAASTAPLGYLECDGDAVSRTTYADLFAVVGITYGAGDGSTTFNLPDLRGQFIRGWANDGTENDQGRLFGSEQEDATAVNNLSLTDPGHSHSASGGATPAGSITGDSGTGAAPGGAVSVSPNTTGITLGSSDTETRPTTWRFCHASRLDLLNKRKQSYYNGFLHVGRTILLQ